MNERIRELAEEAGGQYPRGIYPNAILFYPKDLEKFAELIVRECGEVIINGGYWHHMTEGWSQATPPEIAKMVREHFGVEE